MWQLPHVVSKVYAFLPVLQRELYTRVLYVDNLCCLVRHKTTYQTPVVGVLSPMRLCLLRKIIPVFFVILGWTALLSAIASLAAQ
jgi:hypothetical protein